MPPSIAMTASFVSETGKNFCIGIARKHEHSLQKNLRDIKKMQAMKLQKNV
ncbi:MAG: hypothetical protein K2J11_10840 [Oscillospiraceae bacterium]|nr:hypothetical protein [Oscillospiraceae bacterium]